MDNSDFTKATKFYYAASGGEHNPGDRTSFYSYREVTSDVTVIDATHFEIDGDVYTYQYA